MKYHPQIRPVETTMKEFWLNNFTSLLGRLPPEEALKEADRAMVLCNEHWTEPDWVSTFQYKHSYPVGTQFDGGDREADNGPEPLTR